jgi:predicted O-linked N-acetylglucosamine transferase (SPINDLY family)
MSLSRLSKLIARMRPAHGASDVHDPEEWKTLLTSAWAASQAGDFEQAIRLYDGFIERNPTHPEAYYKRAIASFALGRFESALGDYERTVALNPQHGYAFCNRGTVLERLRRPEEALQSYDRAVAINPEDSLSHYNRASVLKQLGRLQEALISYEKAVALNKDFAEALVNRGNVLQELGRHAEAVQSFDRAIELKPIFAAAFQGRALSLFRLKEFEPAIVALGHALRLDPGLKHLLGFRRQIQMQICDWDGLDRDLQQIEEGLMRGDGVCAPHAMLALVDSTLLHRLAAEIWMRQQCPPSNMLEAIPARGTHPRIRIGYFSSDFRDHAVSLLTAELFELHDRKRFEITAFAFGPESKDAVRTRLERAFDRFIDVGAQSDAEVASLARRLGIDIAVDLNGYTEHSRTGIFAMRAAPVQVSYIGYLGTMGAPYIDYLLADSTVILDSERRNYVEKIAYLPSYQVNDSMRRIGSRIFTREELGLPSSGFVYCSFNANYKFSPSIFAVWMRILKRVDNSSLFVYAESKAAERNLQEAARGFHVEPRRIVFGKRLSREDYLARLQVMDLFLDTLPYNAGTTASDALWAGLPVLTCSGRSFASRMAASILRSIELPELVTSTAGEYEQLAVQLAEDPHLLLRLREKLARNRSRTSLFDTPLFTKHLETAYAKMFERYRDGMPPDDIYVSP